MFSRDFIKSEQGREFMRAFWPHYSASLGRPIPESPVKKLKELQRAKRADAWWAQQLIDWRP